MKVALPSLMTQLTAPFANYMLTGVMAGFGDAAVAVWAVINRLTVLAFGGVFALSGAIGGIFGQNFGALQFDRLRSTYRDAILFCVIYVSVVWAILVLATGGIGRMFDLDQDAMQIFRAFTHVGAGAFLLIGMQYVSNAAFNTLGRPVLATILNWIRDGALVLPAALWLSGFYAAEGVVYGQALAGVSAGIVAGLWGWRFVLSLSSQSTARA
ncbi:MAG: MATE family efflux transporter [Paracoccaceae bacterium]|nr:MATE family efflux transporter [Paracoccaceae bacterium]